MSVNWSRERPPPAADERTLLTGWLDMQRAIVLWKTEDLSDEHARGAPLPGSPLLTMAGLVQHLRWVEHCWFEVILLGRNEHENPQFDQDLPDDADWMTGDRSLDDLVAEYRQQCEVSAETVAGLDLDDQSRHTRWNGLSVRWILQHMIEETARHAGHADLVRELADGVRGYR